MTGEMAYLGQVANTYIRPILLKINYYEKAQTRIISVSYVH